MSDAAELQPQIEERIESFDPRIDLIAVERAGNETLRLYIDHPDGVDLGLCEAVTRELTEFLEAYSLEVSSPGADRLLTKPEHYRRFLGRKVKVRTREAIAGSTNFSGTLTEAGDDAVALDTDGASVRIPLAEIRRSNLIPDFNLGGRL